MTFLIKLTLGLIIFGLMPFTAYGNSTAVHGVVRAVTGDVTLKKANQTEFEKLKLGQRVHPGDTILAGNKSSVKIIMIDENVLSVAADTMIKIERYEYDPTKFEKNVLINMAFGKLRSLVRQRYDEDKNRYIVKTPSAVAGVRGTDFLTIYNSRTNQTQVVTFEGGVNFSMLDSNGNSSRPTEIVAGHTSVNKIEGAPTEPKALPAEELKNLNSESTIREPASVPKDLIERAPEQGSIKPDYSPTHLTSQDLGTCENCDSQPIGPTLELGGFSPTRALEPDTSTCEFCERVIEDGNTTVNIFLVPVGP